MTLRLRKFAREISGVIRIAGWLCFYECLAGLILQLSAAVRSGHLQPADATVARRPHTFKVLRHRVRLNGELFGGAREIYGRSVYFGINGFELHEGGIVFDLEQIVKYSLHSLAASDLRPWRSTLNVISSAKSGLQFGWWIMIKM